MEKPFVDAAQKGIVDDEAIELMSVDGEVCFALILPDVLLIDRNADEVGHDVRESVIVVAFDPNDFNLAFGIREFADVAEEVPVLLGEAAEVEVAEDVSEQDQALAADRFQKRQCIMRPADLTSKMQVREDQRIHISAGAHHTPSISSCNGEHRMKRGLKDGER